MWPDAPEREGCQQGGEQKGKEEEAEEEHRGGKNTGEEKKGVQLRKKQKPSNKIKDAKGEGGGGRKQRSSELRHGHDKVDESTKAESEAQARNSVLHDTKKQKSIRKKNQGVADAKKRKKGEEQLQERARSRAQGK